MTPKQPDAVELDPSVCYRHPGRQSWVLCQRCGRTICPECQILAPVGVHCPECVREAGGSVQWQSTATRPAKRRPARTGRIGAWMQGSGRSTTWIVLVVVLVLFVLGFVTNNLPAYSLAALPGYEWQVWRFVTAPFVYVSGASFSALLSVVLGAVFFWLIGPQLERMLGRPRFVTVFVVSGAASSAAMLLANAPAYGLAGPLFGLFGSLLVEVWDDRAARTQILIMTGFNLVLNIVISGGSSLPLLVMGVLAGAGVSYAYRRWPNGGRTPLLWIWGATAALVLFAVVKGLLV